MQEIKKLLKYFLGLMKNKFYGEIIIVFNEGKIVNLKENKSIKL
jgi:hypothetical protein